VFTTIRRYRVKLGQADEAIRLTENELLPIVSAIPGYVAYQAVVDGPQAIVSVSTYRDRGAAALANSAAEQWDETRLASMIDGPARVTTGEVRFSADATGARSAARAFA
jgi:antibiotic biosynthesis monooxygenase